MFVVSVRNDYLLHCYDLSSGTATEVGKTVSTVHTVLHGSGYLYTAY